MPTKTAHEKAAKDNLSALKYCQERIEDFPQWATVIAFYTALHVVEAVFAADTELTASNRAHSDDHYDRNDKLKRNKRFQHIWKHYQPLFNDSLIARYLQSDRTTPDFFESFSDYMSPSDIVDTHINHNLRQIILSSRRLLDDDRFLA